MSIRRLPVYLLIDISESMAGPAIEAVQRGVEMLVNELRGNPLALESAYLSVITFHKQAQQVVPLTELLQVNVPKFSVRTGTSLGAALKLLVRCLQREVVKSTPTTKGDYKPLVFLLTDGQPTDDWEPAAEAIRKANNPKVANIYAIGCGPDVDPGVLKQVTDIVLMMNDMTPDQMRKFFVWLSASVQTASTRLQEGAGTGAQVAMPDLPEGIEVAPTGNYRRDPSPRQVFLHSRCSRSKRPYLMRFARRPYDSKYEAIASHPLDAIEEGDSDLLPPINTDSLDGCPSCPYCENPIAGMCPCGTLFCTSPGNKGAVICPKCDAQLYAGGPGNFDIKTSAG